MVGQITERTIYEGTRDFDRFLRVEMETHLHSIPLQPIISLLFKQMGQSTATAEFNNFHSISDNKIIHV